MSAIKHIVVIGLAFLSCEKPLDPNENSQWHLQHSFKDGITYYAIAFSDRKNGWAVGYSGTIQKTFDGGKTLNSQNSIDCKEYGYRDIFLSVKVADSFQR